MTINELYRLEEEQRSKVNELAVERDSLQTIRDQLLEEISSKTSLCDEQSKQLLVRIKISFNSSSIFLSLFFLSFSFFFLS